MDIDALYDEPEVLEPQIEVAPAVTEPTQINADEDILTEFLKTRGIADVNKINFEDENGNIEQRSWNSLSREEKFNILGTPLEEPQALIADNNELSDEEILLLNTIRQNNMTPNEYINSLQVASEPRYKIDEYSDDELFLMDLEQRVGELSEEEGAQVLANAKQNEEFFKKQVNGIRKEYKEREDFETQQKLAEEEVAKDAVYRQFAGSVINSIENFNEVGDTALNFSKEDKDFLAEFMLSRDETGESYLMKALREPDNLVKAAWFILNGDEAFNNFTEFFKNEIKLISQNQYRKGFEDAKNGVAPKPSVVINPKKTSSRQMKNYTSIDELDDD